MATCALALAASVAQAAPPISLVPVATGLNSITAVTHAGDGSGRLFITLQSGRVMIFNGTSVLATPFLNISGLVLCCGEQGLLSVAFHPNYPSNGFFYVNYTNPAGSSVLARYHVSANPNVADPASGTILLTIPHPGASNHNGGQLQFGPDGYLYLSLGDGGGGGDPFGNGQNLGALLGKLLRLDVNGAAPYAIPPSNPFVSTPGARPEIWAWGLRNPWRFSFDRSTGDLLIGDVGQGAWEEIDFQPAGSPGGQNYGWNIMEGTHCFSPSSGCSTAGLTLPVLEYNHSGRCSVTGGYVYRGTAGALAGNYLYGDLCSGEIWGAVQTSPGIWTTTPLIDSTLQISTFGQDQNGELYVAHYASSGTLYRIASPFVSIGDASVTEGDSGSVSAVFTVSLSAASTQTVTVQFATANGTAVAGSDYTAASGTVTFPPGSTTQTVSVPVLGDVLDETDETFMVNLTTPVNATLGDAQGVGTILDDDVTISIGDCSVAEGNSGTVSCSFPVTLSGASGRTVTVQFATADGTALSGVDYIGAAGTLTFPPGTTTQFVGVTVLADTRDEPDETFVVNLTAPVNGTIGDGQGVGTILDDDPPPAISIGDCAVVEGNAGTVPCSFAVTLSAQSERTVTVSYATANGSATAGSDYVAQSAGLSFAPGETAKTVTVLVNGDGVVETDEDFFVNLSGAVNATMGDGEGRGTILDDDAPSLSKLELTHGSVETADLAAQPGPAADVDFYRLAQQARASYEITVDATSGDIGPEVLVERLASDNTTVLQTGLAVGTGSAVSLRWENLTAGRVTGQHIRVRSASCTTTCGPDDVYRIRAYETTYAIARFSNAASQVSVLFIQNPAAYAIAGRAYFWDAAGTLLHTQPFSVAPRGLFSLNLSTVPELQGKGGSITVSHEGRYGDLAGKAVGLEPATGFSFDSPMVPRSP